MVSNSEIVSSGVRLFYYDLNVTRWHLKQIFLGKDLIALWKNLSIRHVLIHNV